VERVVEEIEALFAITLRHYNTPMEAEYHAEIEDSPS
jgi:hypothetical protein